MSFYRKHRRLAIVIAAVCVASTLGVVVTSSVTSAGLASQVAVSAAALLGLAIAAARRRARPAQDCGVLVACAASFAVAFSVTEGLVSIVCVGEAIAAMASGTALLFLSAEAAANSTHSRLRK